MMKFVVLALALVAVAHADLKAEETTYLNYGLPLPYAYQYYEQPLLAPTVRYIQPATYIRPAIPLDVNTRILGTDAAGRTIDLQDRAILLAKK